MREKRKLHEGRIEREAEGLGGEGQMGGRQGGRGIWEGFGRFWGTKRPSHTTNIFREERLQTIPR